MTQIIFVQPSHGIDSAKPKNNRQVFHQQHNYSFLKIVALATVVLATIILNYLLFVNRKTNPKIYKIKNVNKKSRNNRQNE
jgi:hypothetical protein